MYDDLVKRLRNKAGGLDYDGWVDTAAILEEAADAIEERDKATLTIQHEMMAEAESHIALVERLNKQIEELQKQVAYWQAQLTKSMCEETLAELEKPRWVSVTEKKPPLPEDEDICFADVIAAIRGRKESAQVKYCRAYRYRDGKRECIERFIDDWEVVDVTHWMPMPEPPKEEA